MTTLETVEHLIEQLSPEELARFRQWFADFDGAEPMQEEGLAEGEYAVWSPYEAHEAAATLMQLLELNKAKTA